MWDWLSKIDPGTVLALVVGVATYVYHRFTPAPAQSAVDHTLSALAGELRAWAATLAPGMTIDRARGDLQGYSAMVLARFGLNADKLPPLVEAGRQAVIAATLSWYFSQPKVTP